jgi:RHS repeat-associated protein
VDSANNAYAVWDDFRDGTNNQNIYYSKRSAGTGTWSTPNLKVNDGSGNTHERNPRIAGTPAGAQTAVWMDLRSNQRNIYSSTLAAGGSAWAANKRVTDNTSSSVAKDFPDVAVGADGTSYAVWEDSRNGNADVFFSSLTSGGSTWAANVKISDDPGTAAQTKARIGVDSANNLVAAWIDARTSPAHVRVARKPSGGSWSASIDISPSPANAQSLALSVRPDGFAWATWGDTRAGATNQDIWGSRYDPNLNTWSAPVRLDDDPGTSANQLNPAVAFGSAEVMLAWRDNRLSANGDTQARRIQVLSGMSDHFVLSYDGLNRLTKVTGPVSETFGLDGPSNVTSRSGTTETYDKANRLTDDGALHNTWSDADRLTQRGSDTFIYDPLDRMTTSNVGGTARTYTYNGDGLLQTRTSGVGASFLWDPSTSVQRELKQGNDNIVYGLGPLYVVKSDTSIVTFARDGGKSIRAEVTSSGAVTGAFRYRAYGQTAQGTSTPGYLGVASQMVDPSGLLYMRARWYDPSTGRFLSRDPVAGQPEAPSSLNSYLYAGANPTRFSDPSGMFCVPCVILLVYAVGYVASQVIPTALDVGATVATFADPESDGGERATMVALTVVGAIDPIGGGYAAIRSGGRGGRPPGTPTRQTQGGKATPGQALSGAEEYLGKGYTEIAPGVYRSADGQRQFRMTDSDLTGTHGDMGSHVHFESIGGNGRDILENSHVQIME